VFASSFQSVLDKKSKQKNLQLTTTGSNQAKTNPRPGVLAGLRAVLIRASDKLLTVSLCLTGLIKNILPDTIDFFIKVIPIVNY
jgi:hypothetical protein